MNQIIECVPNFSEGRDMEVIRQITDRVEAVDGVKLLDVDLRIVLTWDADMTDIDLWVTEPSGEKCYYSHPNTVIGGHMSRDITNGYGPEEYLVRRAMPGKYLIQVNYYGNTQQVIAGATTIQVLLVKNFGRPGEERISLTRRLRDQKEVLTIGDVTFGKKKD